MTPKPPRAAAWLIAFFVPPATAEPAAGDLAEEFAARASRSERQARRWYWRQTVLTIPHLMLAALREAPWLAAGLVVCILGLLGLADRAINGLADVLLANVNAYDYIGAVWFWRGVDAVRFVAMPFALGWSFAAGSRDKEMVITGLTAGVLVAFLCWNISVLFVRGLTSEPALFGSLGGRRIVYEAVQMGTTVPLSLLAGGMMRRLQQVRGSAGVAR
jgi:hypothetical protein